MLPGFLLFTFSFGGVMVPRLNLILDLICKKYFSDHSMKDPDFHFSPIILGDVNPQCQIPEIQALVSNFNLYGNLIAGILSAFTSPIFGSLSDRYGRTRIMAFSLVGMLINEVGFVLAATYPQKIAVQWVFVGFAFEGICGSFTTAMALTFAYGSDCTKPAKRNVTFGYFHAALFSGIGLGPIFAGYIVKASGKIILIFYISLACHSAFLLALLTVIPESLSKNRQLAARARKAEQDAEADVENDYTKPRLYRITGYFKRTNFLAPLSILYPRGEGSSSALRRNLVLLAAVDTTMFGVAMGAISVVILYSEYLFHWATFESTVFVSTVNTCRVLVLLVLLPAITRILRGPKRTAILQNSGSDLIDLSIIRIAIFFDFLGFIGYSIARTGPLFILSGCVASLGGMGSPTLQAVITKHIPEDRTGQVLGAMGLLHAFARVVAPTVFNLIYSLTVAKFPQTVFLSLTACFGLAFVLSWFIRPHGKTTFFPALNLRF